MNLGDLNKVWEVKALKKPGQEEAMEILERIAKQVQPIMRKHNWRVKLLSEFCPNNPALMGLNVGGGIQVKLRLRRPNRDWDFFPFNQVLDTMLHELCHNTHGPHNASFYKLWDELRKECEELMAKGISGSGEGFDLPGKRLGGFSRQPPLSSLRSTALAAAESRSRIASLLPSGPKRLGGDSSIMSALSPIQAAAMAAERRLQDDIWCGSASCGETEAGESSSGSTSHASDDSICRKRGRESDKIYPDGHHFLGSNFLDLTGNSPSGSASNYTATSGADENATWGCETCTLLNPPLALICEVCATQRPKDLSMKYKFWSCKFCTLENGVKLDKCSACDQWRYSYGAPIATQGPNVGT